MNRQKGFTLIELIVVMVILGILAAFAYSRYSDFSNKARANTMQGVLGAVNSATSVVHAAWLAQGDPSATSVTIEGKSSAITVDTNGYPTADSSGICAAVTYGGGITCSAGQFDFTPVVANCHVTYTNDAATAGAGPKAIATTTGC